MTPQEVHQLGLDEARAGNDGFGDGRLIRGGCSRGGGDLLGFALMKEEYAADDG